MPIICKHFYTKKEREKMKEEEEKERRMERRKGARKETAITTRAALKPCTAGHVPWAASSALQNLSQPFQKSPPWFGGREGAQPMSLSGLRK